MIDREARRRLAAALKRLATGKIYDYEFQDLIKGLVNSKDTAVSKIAGHMYIGYDTGGLCAPIRYDSKHRMRKQERRDIARTILFLRGDYAIEYRLASWLYFYFFFSLALIFYTYDSHPQWMPVVILASLLGFPFLGTIFWRIRERLVDDISPFKNRADYEAALRRPYLGAKSIPNI